MINIDTGDKVVTGETRKINIQQGNYTEGNITGGHVSADESKTQNNQGMSKEEIIQLIQNFKQDLTLAHIDLQNDITDAISDDLETVEKQLQKNKPMKSLISRKIDSINGILDDTNSAIDTVEKGNKTLQKLLATGQTIAEAVFLNL